MTIPSPKSLANDPVLLRMMRTSCSLGALLLGLVSLIGYIANIPYLYRWGSPNAITPPMAINTAVAIALLSVSQLLGRRDAK